MRTGSLSLLAALTLAGLSTPAYTATPAPTPVELHIVANAQVPPDRATLPITLHVFGSSRADADAVLAVAEATFKSELDKLKIDPAKVKANEVVADEGESASAMAPAVVVDGVEGPRTKRRNRAEPGIADIAKQVNLSRTYLVEIDDLAKLPELALLRQAESYEGGRFRPVFSASDPAAARAKARDLALAKARKDADETAAAMGYRVVRLVRVSNAKPPVNMQDLFDFVSMIDNRSNMMQPSYFTATAIETVAIDYLMVPK